MLFLSIGSSPFIRNGCQFVIFVHLHRLRFKLFFFISINCDFTHSYCCPQRKIRVEIVLKCLTRDAS